MDDLAGFARHLRRCNNTALPGGRRELRLGSQVIGYVAAALAERLAPGQASVTVADPAALHALGRRIAEAGHVKWRDEDFDVRAHEDGPVLATLDRGVLPDLGIAATGVHMNGLVERDGETFLWVARRAANKLLDPGKLDHLAAGGVSAGMTPGATIAKEAEEECGLAGALAAGIRPVGTIRYVMARPEGLRRDVLRCYDVVLPADWQPEAMDGEVESFELWPLARAFREVRDSDAFKFNVNLVLIDLFLRRGLLDPASHAGATLRRGLDGHTSNETP